MTRNDYSILEKIGLDLPPVGVKFCYYRPEGVPPLEKDAKLSLCEMLRACQRENRCFYFSKDNYETCVGKMILGMQEFTGFEKSGQIGPLLGVFDETRCNQHFYRHIPTLDTGIANYALFSPAPLLTFEPDVLVIAAAPEQAEIVMRSMTYSTGEMYRSVCTPVIGCSWLLAQPYITGEGNYIIPALIHGMHGRQLYASDTLLIGVPYQWIPTMLSNLARMPLHLEGHRGRDEYLAEFEGILSGLNRS